MNTRLHLVARGLSHAALALLAALFVAPIAFMMIGSLEPDTSVMTGAAGWRVFLPDDVSLENYRDVLARVPFVRYLLNSLLITGTVVAAGLGVNSLAGYGFARLSWSGRDRLFALVVGVMIIPLESIAVPLFYEVTRLGWRDTYVAQIAPFIANAFSIALFRTYFLTLPRELEDAAQVDGAGPLRIFWTIVVPNSKPVFGTVATLTFLTQWGMYLWPVMVTSSERVRPLPLGIATFQALPPLQWGDIFAFGVMMVAPVLLAFIVFQRWFVRSVAATGIRG